MQNYNINDEVEIYNVGKLYDVGTIVELWSGSLEEKMSCHYGLDKYRVKCKSGSHWLYGCDLKLKNNDVDNNFKLKNNNIENNSNGDNSNHTSESSDILSHQSSQFSKNEIINFVVLFLIFYFLIFV